MLESYAEYYSADLSEKVVRGMTENLYDDKVLITFNYKEGTETITFGEAVKAEKSSDMSARGAPDVERQIVRFDVLFYVGKRLHTFCTPFAHLPESGAFLRMACTACFPLHKKKRS